MTQALDIPSRFSPPEDAATDPDYGPPPHFRSWDCWQETREGLIAENAAALTQVLGAGNVSWFSGTTCEHLTITLDLPQLNPADTWVEYIGHDGLFDCDVAYDVRRDLLAKLTQLRDAVARDIEERPLK